MHAPRCPRVGKGASCESDPLECAKLPSWALTSPVHVKVVQVSALHAPAGMAKRDEQVVSRLVVAPRIDHCFDEDHSTKAGVRRVTRPTHGASR